MLFFYIVMNPRPSVLIVDDVDANLVALEALLEALNCELVRAKNGNEALSQLLKRDYAVMLLDVQMPVMDGYEVAKWARENPRTRDVPIIFLTAMSENEENVLRGYGTGAVDVLFKPINAYVLRSKVQVFLDLYTSRRNLEREIDAHKKTLAELEAFNYSVSHDLRAPLRPLEGFSKALLDDYGDVLDEHARDYLNRIRAASQRMSQLIEDLLRLSQIRRAEVRPEKVDLAALARAIVDELRRSDGDRRVELVIPEITTDADARLVRIALENLLRNAWKFTRKKTAARIELGVRKDPGETVFFVRDDGIGFDPAFAKRLFQPFQRFHPAGEFEGTGIGLAIVDRIIQHHQGRIWAEATPDGGATFYFTLAPRSRP